MTPQEAWRASIFWPLTLAAFGSAVLCFVIWGVVRTAGLLVQREFDDPPPSAKP